MSRNRSPHAAGRAPSQRQLRVGELIRHAIAETPPARRGPRPRSRRAGGHRARGAHDAGPAGWPPSSSCRSAARTPTRLVAALDRHRKFLRGEVGHRVDLRYAPDLRFRLDESFEEGERIDSLLRSPEVKRDLDGE